jgi:hypothetical protein
MYTEEDFVFIKQFAGICVADMFSVSRHECPTALLLLTVSSFTVIDGYDLYKMCKYFDCFMTTVSDE